MKKSNLLLVAALVLVLISLTAYNKSISTIYTNTNFNDPFLNYTSLNLKDFDEIEVNDLNVEIKQDTFGVRVHNNIQNRIKIIKQGRRLIINYLPQPNWDNTWYGSQILISCPNLKVIRTNTLYPSNERLIAAIKTISPPYQISQFYTHSTIKGFKQDSLQVEVIDLAAITLENNTIQKLTASIGHSSGKRASLVILHDNNIKAANLTIHNNSSLGLDNVHIPDLKYTLGDNAKVTLTGTNLALLKQ